MSNSTSIGRGPAHGSNENHDGDPRNRTLGEKASQDDPPGGNEALEPEVRDTPKRPPDVKPVDPSRPS
jgi:hypothetical protein